MKDNLKFTINWWGKFLKDMCNLPCLLGIISFTIISIVSTLLLGSTIVPAAILLIGIIILMTSDNEDCNTFGSDFIFGVLILLVLLFLVIMFCWDYYWFLYEKRGGNR